MKKIFWMLLLWAGQQGLVFAQDLKQTIRGTVIDLESKTPLIGANVIVLGTDPILASSTDVDGNFKIEKVPLGRHSIKISYIGYEESLIPEILVGSGKEVVLSIPLRESLNQVAEIEIMAETEKGTPLNDMATVSARSFSVEETKRYAAAVNDPARMALSFAGVVANEDTGNEIIIRGNSPRGLLWRLESIEIPSPNHFSEEGASGGAVSVLSVNMLDNSDFFTGAFPAEYGNASSGVFDIRLRKGNNQKKEYALQAGVLGVDFALEGPFSKKSNASYLVNYRYSTLAILNSIGVKIAGETVPKFQDLSFKLHFPSKSAGSFSVWGISGLNSQDILANRDVSTWKKSGDRFDQYINGKMWATGISHIYYLSDDTYLESALSFSGTNKRYQADSLNTSLEKILHYKDNFMNTAIRGSLLWNKKFNAHHTLRAGLIVSQLGFNLNASRENEDLDGYQLEQLTDRRGNAQLYQAYVQWKYRIATGLTLNTGVHGMYFGLNNNRTIEPRAGLQWQFSPSQSLNLGIGRHSRIEPMITYFGQQTLTDGSVVTPNKNLDFTRATHYVLGYNHRLKDDLNLKLEVYYQNLRGVPVSSPFTADPEELTASGINAEEGFIVSDTMYNDGKGRNYGIDLTLEKFFTNNYYFMLTGSLYQSKYTARDGLERNTRFNGNYVVNGLFGKEFKVGREGKNLIGINFRGLLAGGNRTTPIDLAASQAKGEGVYLWEQRYNDQRPAYWRLDTRLSYHINKKRSTHVLSLDIQNVTNRLNIYGTYFDKESNAIETIYQNGLIPILNYRLEF